MNLLPENPEPAACGDCPTRSGKRIAAAQVTLFAILACWIFSGTNHIFYTNLYQFVRGDFSYANDIYLQNSFFYGSSALWWFLKFTGLPLENDLIGLAVHLLLSSVAVLFVWRLIERVLPAPTFQDGMNLLLLLAVHDSSILDTTRNGILTWHSNTPTTFASPLMFGVFYFMIKGRYGLASALGTGMVLIAVKAAWAPLAVATIFGCFFCRGGIARWVWFMPPLAATAFLAKNAPHGFDSATALKLTELALTRDTWESAIDLQPPMRLFLLGLSFIAFIPLNLRILDDRFRRFGWAVLATTVFIVVVTSAYTAFGYRFFPNPSFVSLGPVRATNVYHFFFFLLAYAALLHNSTLPRWCNLLLLGALYFFSHVWFIQKKQIMLFALICTGVLAVFVVVAALWNRGSWRKLRTLACREACDPGTRPSLTVMVTVAGVASYVLFCACPGFNTDGFLALRRWTLPPIDRPRLESLLALRQCREDFTLLVIGSQRPLTPEFISEGALSVDMTASAIAGKSQFYGDFAHFYFDLSLYREHTERGALAGALIRALNAESAPGADVVNGLAERRVVVLLPTGLATALESQVPVKHFPSGWSGAVFDRTGNYEAILNQHLAAHAPQLQ